MNSNSNNFNKHLDSEIESNVPFIARQFISEQQKGSWFGGVVKQLQSAAGQYAKDLSSSASLSKLENTQRMRTELLYPHYANHLGVKPSYVEEVLTKYKKEHPGPKPAPASEERILVTKGKNKGRVITRLVPTPNYHVRLSDWTRDIKEFQEFSKLKTQIQGLHSQFPHLKHMDDQINRDIDFARKNI